MGVLPSSLPSSALIIFIFVKADETKATSALSQPLILPQKPPLELSSIPVIPSAHKTLGNIHLGTRIIQNSTKGLGLRADGSCLPKFLHLQPSRAVKFWIFLPHDKLSVCLSVWMVLGNPQAQHLRDGMGLGWDELWGISRILGFWAIFPSQLNFGSLSKIWFFPLGINLSHPLFLPVCTQNKKMQNYGKIKDWVEPSAGAKSHLRAAQFTTDGAARTWEAPRIPELTQATHSHWECTFPWFPHSLEIGATGTSF